MRSDLRIPGTRQKAISGEGAGLWRAIPGRPAKPRAWALQMTHRPSHTWWLGRDALESMDLGRYHVTAATMDGAGTDFRDPDHQSQADGPRDVVLNHVK